MYVPVVVLVLCGVSLVDVCRGADVTVKSSFSNRKLRVPLLLPDIDGNSTDLEYLQILELHFQRPSAYDTHTHISLIKNFPSLTAVRITDDFGLTQVPAFDNVPRIKQVTIHYNNLTRVTTTSLPNSSIQKVDLSYNLITHVDDNSFGENLTHLIMACNNLTQVSAKWFKDPTRMIQVDLGGNQISHLEDNFLHNFTELVILLLGSNQIKSIGSGALSGPTRLHRFDLAYNTITRLQPSVFSAKRNRVKTFSLSFNRLNYLAPAFLRKLDVENFYIQGNPWQCPCLEKIERWWARKCKGECKLLSKLEDDPSCVFTLEHPKVCVEYYDPELFDHFKKNANAYRNYVRCLSKEQNMRYFPTTEGPLHDEFGF